MSINFRWSTPSIPPVTKHIIIVNVILWLTTFLFGNRGIIDLNKYLALHFWQASDFHFYQLFTYMFMHDSQGISHIFFNMFSLWMFGGLLERVMGYKRYLIFYIVCGLGAGLVQELVWQLQVGDFNINDRIDIGPAIIGVGEFYNMLITVGASGAVFGILLAFGVLFPNMPIYIMFVPIPIKAKWAVLGYGALELFFGLSGTMDNVAHFAHLGGMLFGFLLLLYWRNKGLFYHRDS